MKSRHKRSPRMSSISTEKSDGHSSQSGASATDTQDSRSYVSDATGYNNSDYDDRSCLQNGSSSRTSIASMAKTTTGLTHLVQSTIAKLKNKGGCPVKIIRQDIKDSHGYTLTGAHNTRRLNSVLKKLQKVGKIVKTAKGYKLVPAELRRKRRHHRHKAKKGRRRRRRRRGRGRGKRRRKFRRAGRKHRHRRRRRRRHGPHKGRKKGHSRRRRRTRRKHGRKHAATTGGRGSKTAKLRRGVAKLSYSKGSKSGPLPGGPVGGGGAGPALEGGGASPPSKSASRLPSRSASRLASRNPSPACQRPSKRAKALALAASVDDDYDD